MYKFIHVFEGAKHLSMKQTKFVQQYHNALFHISSQRGRTTLHVASQAGQTAVVTLLLDHGADVHAVDKLVGGVCVCIVFCECLQTHKASNAKCSKFHETGTH